MATLDHIMDNFALMGFEKPPRNFLAARIKRGRYLFLNMPPRPGRVAVVCAGWEECHRDYEIARPSFPYEAVELLAGGEWDVIVSGREHRCGPGFAVIYGPARPCSIKAAGQGPHLKYFVDLAGKRARDLLGECGLYARGILPCVESTHVGGLFEQILSCSDLRANGRDATVCALVEALLRRAAAGRRTARKPGLPSAGTFERCRTYMESHYPSIVSISQAAAACHVSAPYFSRLFRRHTGTTAERYLSLLRVNHAARLLQQSGMTVKEAGQEVGFKDPYHFSRAFKRVHGKAPRDFR